MKLVADGTQDLPKWGSSWVVLRKDLADSGQVKTPADLKGMKIAIPSQGSYAQMIVELALAEGLGNAILPGQPFSHNGILGHREHLLVMVSNAGRPPAPGAPRLMVSSRQEHHQIWTVACLAHQPDAVKER